MLHKQIYRRGLEMKRKALNKGSEMKKNEFPRDETAEQRREKEPKKIYS